jgi:formyltetrahydrofolate deformylase
VLLQQRCTIVESHAVPQRRRPGGTFYLRVEFAAATGALDLPACAGFEPPRSGSHDLAPGRRRRAPARGRHGSQYAHCLHDLLFRNSIGELHLDVVAVVSNHPDLRGVAEFYGVPFRHIPVTRETKPQAEASCSSSCARSRSSSSSWPATCRSCPTACAASSRGRAINIHHSMLPSFKGARPYHQAHDRGVKFIGATAHYVTADLDEGPIIEQEMLRVDHSLGPEQLAARGREAETRALARAVRWHTENRIVIHGSRTVVFE